MNPEGLGVLVEQLRQLAEPRRARDWSDGELLERFLNRREQAAFGVLMHRHGAMVFRVCCRLLDSHQDAEDAFQATFLVLARRAAAIRKRASVASWLHGVASRVALRMRARMRSRPECALKHEPTSAQDGSDEAIRRELLLSLDEAFRSLPRRYRAAAVLCLLEGKSHAEAAEELGSPRTTITSRLERARELLRMRLERRGIGISSAALATVVASQTVSAALPARLFLATLRAVTGKMIEAGSLPAASVADAVVRAMFLTRLKMTAACLLVLAALGSLTGALASRAASENTTTADDQRPARALASAGEKRLERDAIRADGLDETLPEGAIARLGTTSLRHGDMVRALGFFPDGKTLVSADWHRVHVWDTASGRRLRTFGDPRGRQFQSIALSGDCRTVALSMSDGPIDIWDATTGERLRQFQAGRFATLVLSPDGKTMAVHDSDWNDKASLRLWDALTGKELHVLVGHTDAIHALLFSADGKMLVSAGDDKSVRFWDVKSGKQVRQIDHPDLIGHVAISADGKTLALVGTTKHVHKEEKQVSVMWLAKETVVLLDVATGKETHRLKTGAEQANVFAFTDDGKVLLVCGKNAVEFWDVGMGKKLDARGLPTRWVSRLAFAADGKTLATGGGDNVIRLWDLATGAEKRTRTGHDSCVGSVAVSPDGRLFATGSNDRFIRLWDAATGKERGRFQGGTDGVWKLAFMRDSHRLFFTGIDGSGRVWDVVTGKELRRVEAGLSTVTHDGRIVTAAPKERLVRIVDMATGEEVRRWKTPGPLTNLGVSSDGHMLFGLEGDDQGKDWPPPISKRVRIWNLADGKEVRAFGVRPFGGDEHINRSAFSPDGRHVAFAAPRTRHLAVYDMTTGQITKRLNSSDLTTSFVFSPDGRILASSDWVQGAVHLWEVVTGQEFRGFAGHQGRVVSMAFSADGSLLLTGSEDTTALVWDIMGLRSKRAAKPPDEDGLSELWKDLGAADAVRGQRAVGILAAHPRETMPFLAKRLTPVRATDPKEVVRLIAELGSADFKTRDRAQLSLEPLWETAAPALRQALARQPSLEARQRLERLLDNMTRPQSPPRLRVLRALQALEIIRAPEACDVLQALAAGASGAWPTEEARAALQRLR
jgi:RNA polymerase sigma factor (sigma-70 family)